jgi:hypothetical protein
VAKLSGAPTPNAIRQAVAKGLTGEQRQQVERDARAIKVEIEKN